MTLIRHMSMSVRVRLRKTKAQPYLFRAAAHLQTTVKCLKLLSIGLAWEVRALNFGVFSADFRRGMTYAPAHL